MPCGTISSPDGKDLQYMSELLTLIEATDLPTPAPIEQRWTRRSRAVMSPAHSKGDDDLHSWVGIIMYAASSSNTRQQAKYTATTQPAHSLSSHPPLLSLSLSLQVPAHSGRRAARRHHQTLLGVQRALPRQALAQIRLPSALGEDRDTGNGGGAREDEGEVKGALPFGGAVQRKEAARSEGCSGE